MRHVVGVVTLSLALGGCDIAGLTDEPRIEACVRAPIRPQRTTANNELTIVNATGTVETATADSFHVALGFRVASAELFGGVPVAGAQITIAIREGTAALGSTSLTTNAQGIAGTTGTFERPLIVLDITAMLPNSGGEANKSPAVVCLEIVDP